MLRLTRDQNAFFGVLPTGLVVQEGYTGRAITLRFEFGAGELLLDDDWWELVSKGGGGPQLLRGLRAAGVPWLRGLPLQPEHGVQGAKPANEKKIIIARVF